MFVHLGVSFCHFGVILGTKIVPKATQGHLWGPMAPQGGPLSAQGCHLVGFGDHFGVVLGTLSAQKWHQDQYQKTMICGDGF